MQSSHARVTDRLRSRFPRCDNRADGAQNSRSIAFLDGRTLIDDSYYSLEIAKNIGQGKGPLYGTAMTNGFQQRYLRKVGQVHGIRSLAVTWFVFEVL